jgi:hypothetical protein
VAEKKAEEEVQLRLERLLESVNEATRTTRTHFLILMLAGLYFAILIGATTDEQFLREIDIVLPLVNIGLPIVTFYAITSMCFCSSTSCRGKFIAFVRRHEMK